MPTRSLSATDCRSIILTCVFWQSVVLVVQVRLLLLSISMVALQQLISVIRLMVTLILRPVPPELLGSRIKLPVTMWQLPCCTYSKKFRRPLPVWLILAQKKE